MHLGQEWDFVFDVDIQVRSTKVRRISVKVSVEGSFKHLLIKAAIKSEPEVKYSFTGADEEQPWPLLKSEPACVPCSVLACSHAGGRPHAQAGVQQG
jgi:hypothetical protein